MGFIVTALYQRYDAFQSQPCDGGHLTTYSRKRLAPMIEFQSQPCDGGHLTYRFDGFAPISVQRSFQSQPCDGGHLTEAVSLIREFITWLRRFNRNPATVAT